MCKLPVKRQSKVQTFLELRQLQIRPFLGISKCWGRSVLQTLALVLFVCRVRLISYEISVV